MIRPASPPPPVRPGDRVALAAISGPFPKERVDDALDAVRELGYEPVAAPNLRSRHDLFAGSDDERLEALHAIADDPSIAAVIFARGGHGVLRLLPRMDWTRLGRCPRAWVGYSDLTAFLLPLVERTGVAAFHGPMGIDLARGVEGEDRVSLLAALEGRFPIAVAAPLSTGADTGPVKGVSTGGCLSLLCSLLGTPWAPPLEGSILLLEEVGEPLYRIDRMLTHLGVSGNLTGVRGALVGGLRGTDEDDDRVSSVPERIRSWIPGAPILHGAPFGHQTPNRTLPLGLPAVLDPGRRTVVFGTDRNDAR